MIPTTSTAIMDGKTAGEHAQAAADAVRAINHLTYHDTALPHPADTWRLLGQLATAAHRLPQALQQTGQLLARKHARLEIGIDAGTDYAGHAEAAVGDTLAALHAAEAAAGQLAEALDRAAAPLTYAHHLDSDTTEMAVEDDGAGVGE
jgi:hypothetical protein